MNYTIFMDAKFICVLCSDFEFNLSGQIFYLLMRSGNRLSELVGRWLGINSFGIWNLFGIWSGITLHGLGTCLSQYFWFLVGRTGKRGGGREGKKSKFDLTGKRNQIKKKVKCKVWRRGEEEKKWYSTNQKGRKFNSVKKRKNQFC